jgi:hypothetical protein
MTIKAALHSLLLVALAIITPVVAQANERTPYFILIPVVASHAHDSAGAAWSSTVSFIYAGDYPTLVFNDPFIDYREMQPGERGILDIHAAEAKAGPGVIIVTYAAPPQLLYIQEYVYNDAQPGVGVAVPAVRFSDLTPGQTVRLIGIPVQTTSRTLVRIYGMANYDPNVLVHVFDPSGRTLTTDLVHLVSPPLLPTQTNIGQPAYAEYRPSVDAAKYSSISIDIEPVSLRPDLGPAIWAFSTTTAASSESVTAVFPAK